MCVCVWMKDLIFGFGIPRRRLKNIQHLNIVQYSSTSQWNFSENSLSPCGKTISNSPLEFENGETSILVPRKSTTEQHLKKKIIIV